GQPSTAIRGRVAGNHCGRFTPRQPSQTNSAAISSSAGSILSDRRASTPTCRRSEWSTNTWWTAFAIARSSAVYRNETGHRYAVRRDHDSPERQRSQPSRSADGRPRSTRGAPREVGYALDRVQNGQTP